MESKIRKAVNIDGTGKRGEEQRIALSMPEPLEVRVTRLEEEVRILKELVGI